MANNIPPLKVKGIFELVSPWAADPSKLYTCMALRKFEEIENDGVDIVALYYEPFGLEESDYQESITAGAVLVTLLSSDDEYIYVPSNYIASFPTVGNINYQYTVLSVPLFIPDSLQLDALVADIVDVTKQVTGVDVSVKTNTLASTTIVSAAQHDAFEAARAAAVAARTSPYLRIQELESLVSKKDQIIAIMQKKLKDAGLL